MRRLLTSQAGERLRMLPMLKPREVMETRSRWKNRGKKAPIAWAWRAQNSTSAGAAAMKAVCRHKSQAAMSRDRAKKTWFEVRLVFVQKTRKPSTTFTVSTSGIVI